MNTFKVTQVEKLFGVTGNTIRRWADEFSEYLSENANPGSGKTRVFTDDDLGVFALVSNMQDLGHTFENIHSSLRSGQRGEIPTAPKGVATWDDNAKRESYIQRLEARLEASQQETAQLKIEIARLQMKIEILESSQTSRDDLLIQIGELRAKLAALEGKG